MIGTVRSRKRKHQSMDIDLSIVPSNVFSLRGEPFYRFIQEITSEDIKDLLEIQRISTARCFLQTNPLGFLDLRSEDPLIIHLQNRLCFRLSNEGHVVRAGVIGDLRYLAELLSTYSMESNKQRNVQSEYDPPIQTNEGDDALTTATPSVPPVPESSIEEHRYYINEQLKSWWEKNREKHQFKSHQLIDSQDYQLIITTDSASILCSCRVKINLSSPKDRSSYQLSNFYKHLIKSRKCKKMREQRISSEFQEDKNDDGNSDPSSPSSPVPPIPKKLRDSGSPFMPDDHRQMPRSIDDSSSRSKKKR